MQREYVENKIKNKNCFVYYNNGDIREVSYLGGGTYIFNDITSDNLKFIINMIMELGSISHISYIK